MPNSKECSLHWRFDLLKPQCLIEFTQLRMCYPATCGAIIPKQIVFGLSIKDPLIFDLPLALRLQAHNVAPLPIRTIRSFQ
jgi:hypothetical protein